MRQEQLKAELFTMVYVQMICTLIFESEFLEKIHTWKHFWNVYRKTLNWGTLFRIIALESNFFLPFHDEKFGIVQCLEDNKFPENAKTVWMVGCCHLRYDINDDNEHVFDL